MYIFGDPSQELSVAKRPTVDVPRALKVSKSQSFYTPEYYNRVYERLLSVSGKPYTPKPFQSRLDSVNDSLINQKSPALKDPDIHFILGQRMVRFLKGDNVVLDREAVIALEHMFEQYGVLHLRILGKTYNTWRNFAESTVGTISSAPRGIEFGMKISYVDKNTARHVIRGKMIFTEDLWGFHPVSFLPNNLLRNRSLDEGVIGLNKILADRHLRRKMAEAYIGRPNSKLMSRDTFQEAMEIILPFAPKSEKHDPSVFDPLCGGRTPVDTHLVFRSSFDANRTPLRIRVVRCRSCGVPQEMKLEQPFNDGQVLITKENRAVYTALIRASRFLARGHDSTNC